MLSTADRVRATVRALRGGELLAILALAVAPVAVTVIRGGHDFELAVAAAVLVGAAVLARSVEDPAVHVLDALPVSLAHRRVERMVVVVAAVACAATAVVLLIAAAEAAPIRPDARLAELAAGAGIAASVAAFGYRRSTDEPVVTGMLSGPLALLACSAAAMRFPRLPMLGDDADHAAWWSIAAAAWLGVAWFNRDGYRRGLRPGRGAPRSPRWRASGGSRAR